MLEYKPDAIVAVGGGSAIDSSKSIREFALRVDHYAEVGLIAIPTTSGTGSEVTSFAVVSDPAEQRKYPLVSWELTPDEAILDAELVKSVPPAITADTGMDVFTHALEACVSTARSDFSTALAEKSIELVGVFLLRAYTDGNDTHARQKMHSASCPGRTGIQLSISRTEPWYGSSVRCKVPHPTRTCERNASSTYH